MSCFLVRFEDAYYANDELYIDAIAKGERSFSKMLFNKEVIGKKVFDQALYPLTDAQIEICRQFQPAEQDFDETYKLLNVISAGTVQRIKEKMEEGYPDAHVITLKPPFVPSLYKYRQVTFFRVQDFKQNKKYAMVPKMAAIKVCGRLYVAINAVSVRIDTPIIVTVSE